MKKPLLRLKSPAGFTLLEVLVAMTFFALGILALASLSISLVGSNQTSKKYLEATVLAQSVLESMRFFRYDLGADSTLGTTDDLYYSSDATGATAVTGSHPLKNPNTGNDLETDPATLFTSPDHAYDAALESGYWVENSTLMDSPALTIDAFPRRVWVVRDNYPVSGMKTISVVVGWLEGKGVMTAGNYVVVSTVVRERRN